MHRNICEYRSISRNMHRYTEIHFLLYRYLSSHRYTSENFGSMHIEIQTSYLKLCSKTYHNNFYERPQVIIVWHTETRLEVDDTGHCHFVSQSCECGWYNHLPHRKTFEPHAAIHIEISMHIARYKLIVELEIKYLQQSGENTQLD